MTEDVKPVEGEVVQEEKKVSPVEAKAMEMGWRPLEEFDGDEADFIDAKEFVNRKPLFEKIEHQSRELKSVKKALDALKDHYTKVQDTEFKRAMAELKATQKKALVDGDVEKFYEVDEQIEQAQEQAAELREAQKSIQVEEAPVVHPEFAAWSNRNAWYGSQPHMRVFADDVGRKLAAQGLSPNEVLKKVEEEVRKEFPNKFRNPNRDNAPAVEASSRGGNGRAKDDFELNDQERTIMNTLVRQGVLTKEKYIADLKKAKGLS